jgi:hypothetical protein
MIVLVVSWLRKGVEGDKTAFCVTLDYITGIGERQLCCGTSVLVLGLRLTAIASLGYNLFIMLS